MTGSGGIDYRERRLTAEDGLSLYYRDYGDPLSLRTPLLCLSGMVRNSADFADVARRHAGERRVLCPDYRGRGRSDRDPDWRRYEPRIYLGDIADLLAANDIVRIIVLGTSMGGLLAMGLAALRPRQVVGVVLNDIGPQIATSGYGRVLDYIGADRPQPDWPSAMAFLRALLPTLSLRGDAEWLDFARATYWPGADGRLHFDWDFNIAKALKNGGPIPDLWPLYRALGDRPVLALRGALSDLLSEESFARMQTAKPDLVAVTVPDCGHAPSLNEPIARKALDDFLARF